MEQQRKRIDLELVKSLMDDKYHLLYVDCNDNLNGRPEVFSRCIEDKKADYLHDLFNYWYQDQEYNNAGEAMEELKKRVVATGYKRWQAEKFFEENEDDVRDEIYSRGEYDGVEKLLRNTRDIPVRVEMLSNYDCINSHWLESQGGFSYEESYFGDMIDALWLNPKKVKQLLAENGEKVCGRFPNRAYRDGRELVSYERFYEELINSSCGANLLTFTATINPMKLYESGFNLSTLTIPRGNRCGLFSSTYGGGSILEMVLERDVTVDLERTKYPKYRLEFETNGRDYNYSIRQVYGYDSTSYGESARIEPLHRNKRISA
jgi:hypothetical protein